MIIRFRNQFDPILHRHPFYVIDAGARGGYKKELYPLRKFLNVIGFEPDGEECSRLVQNGHQQPEIMYLNSALYNQETDLVLHVTKHEGLSSVYPPNNDFLRHFHASNVNGYEVSKKVKIKADKLENVLPSKLKGKIDYIKIDVEGCAYEVLQGAAGLFKENLILGVRVEAEFNEKFKGQRFFADVDGLLRPHHFQLFDAQICRWKRTAGLKTAGSSGQLIHGDFIYFLRLEDFFSQAERLDAVERLSKVIKFIIFCCMHGVYDLAYEILHEAAERGVVDSDSVLRIKKSLKASQGLLARMPKLKGRNPWTDMAFHLFMLCGGIWLEKWNYWEPRIQL